MHLQVARGEQTADPLTDRDWRIHPLHIALLDQHFERLLAQRFHLRLLQNLAALQLLYPSIQL